MNKVNFNNKPLDTKAATLRMNKVKEHLFAMFGFITTSLNPCFIYIPKVIMDMIQFFHPCHAWISR